MAKVHDVCKYILEKTGPITAMKLQKLLYYCQAWSLVWDENPLFKEKIEAWISGPVIPIIYNKHKGCFKIDRWQWGKTNNLKNHEKETIDAVLDYYGSMTSQQLSDLTHAEDPWKAAREGLSDNERGSHEITPASMMEYYSFIPSEN